MNTKRFYHSCFTDEKTSSIYIVGGFEDQMTRLSSTEKWTFEQNSWQPSANFPKPISSSTAVSSYTDEFIGYMAGGYPTRYSKNIYGLRRRQIEWIKLNKTIKTRRYAHSLLNIPADQILEC